MRGELRSEHRLKFSTSSKWDKPKMPCWLRPLWTAHLDVAVAANRTPVTKARLAWELQDIDLLPEDIALRRI